MKAVIRASQTEKRLSPLNETAPTAGLRLFSKPLIGYTLDLLKEYGFDEVIISVGFMGKRIEDYVRSRSQDGFKLRCVQESNSLGTAGSLKKLAKDFSQPFLVINGECLCDFNLSQLMEFHISHGADVTLAVQKHKSRERRDITDFSALDKVNTFTDETALSDEKSGDIFVMNPSVLDLVSDKKDFDFLKDLLPHLMREGRSILRCECDGYFTKITTLSQYTDCLKAIMNAETRIRLERVTGAVFSDGALASGDYGIVEPCYISSKASIAPGAVIGPFSVIGEGCRIGENSRIENSCLTAFCEVEENAFLSGAIICDNASVGAGSVISENAIIGPDAKVSSGCRIARSVTVPSGGFVERGSGVAFNNNHCFFNDNDRFSGSFSCSLDSVNASLIGQALASMEIGEKTGIMTDSVAASKSVCHSLIGALTAHGARVWRFSDGFYSQLEFYVRFCALKSGIFVSCRGSQVSISLCGENGLPLSQLSCRELENRIRYREFRLCQPRDCKEVSDMSGVSLMYRRELIKQTETELSDVSCIIKCPNEKIVSLLEDCLYSLGCRTGDGITFKINSYGTLLSAFSRECGWLSHDRLCAIIVNYETACGRDISVCRDTPSVFDSIAEKNGKKLLRYYRMPTDTSDSVAREKSRANPFMRDALLMAVRLLGIICSTGRSLSELSASLPDFYVSRRKISLPPDSELIKERLFEKASGTTRESISFTFPNGTVTLFPTRTGRGLNMLSEAANYEISKELCSEVEKLIKGKDR